MTKTRSSEAEHFLYTEGVGIAKFPASICKNWKRYKGIHKPRCNSGDGCPKCWEIYDGRVAQE